MITINSIDEIKKYITEENYNNVDDCNHITYTFVINNQLQDVEFNIDMNLSAEQQLESLSKEENLTMHCLIAKDIKFNVGCRLHKVIANNLQAKNICDIEQLEIQKTGNPYISCFFSFSPNFQLLSIFENLTTVDNKSPSLTHRNTKFFHLKSSKLA